MPLKIDELINTFWNKTEKIILEDNEISPMIFGIKGDTKGNFTPIDLFLDQSLYEWGNPEDRFELYYRAFKAKNTISIQKLFEGFENESLT